MAKTVLVVDDDRLMRNICSRALSRGDWTVQCAESGDQALSEIRENPGGIHVILLDHMMPGMSGMEVLERIRAINPDIPVIVMTGSVTPESALEVVEQGAFHCIPKPFTPNEIREVVERAAASTPPQTPRFPQIITD
jgi:DNA-binding NtrC family response regulator